jgi:hypothetical protein
MTWHFPLTSGLVQDVKASFLEYGESLHGNPRAEFDACKPHIIGLIDQNYDKRLDADDVRISLEAHGMWLTESPVPGVMGGQPTAISRQCTVHIGPAAR